MVSLGGSSLPHYMSRLDRNYSCSDQPENLTRRPSEYLRSLYYDTCVYGSHVLENLVDQVGADRFVLGRITR